MAGAEPVAGDEEMKEMRGKGEGGEVGAWRHCKGSGFSLESDNGSHGKAFS